MLVHLELKKAGYHQFPPTEMVFFSLVQHLEKDDVLGVVILDGGDPDAGCGEVNLDGGGPDEGGGEAMPGDEGFKIGSRTDLL